MKVLSLLLNDKIISNEKFLKSQNLKDIRNILENKIKCSFIFLDQSGNSVDKNDESDYSLEDILDNYSIKLKGNTHSSSVTIPIFL